MKELDPQFVTAGFTIIVFLAVLLGLFEGVKWISGAWAGWQVRRRHAELTRRAVNEPKTSGVDSEGRHYEDVDVELNGAIFHLRRFGPHSDWLYRLSD